MVLRWLHAAAAAAFVATILIQVFLAGAAMANLGGSGDFGSHIDFGYTWVGIAALALVVTALMARRSRIDVGITAALLLLYILQTLLPAAKASMPSIAALHPVNALLLFAIAGWYARRTIAATRADAATRAEAATRADAAASTH